ncbi:MAG: NUDIX hydrolase [Anaerolineae bacterium]|jgi:8-oxo-dGTP pyrophosphatase MutT (NUDIX family)|nr:NUDIX hydrolase [Anaerolineae bacterium]MBT7072607.1 NUDIX hydrolase [Anaerolineae bacterium]MBT7324561.1 NUDIX hydrolase [Anaerolineae bacterium]
MTAQQIRVITICIIRKGDAIFVFEDIDEVTNETFYRPLGGGIEYGEYSRTALQREFREEINADLLNLRYIQTLENIFICDGEQGHEIVIVYEGDFVDQSFYDKEVVILTEDNGEKLKALWVPIADFRAGKFPLYPDGLLELLLES